MDSCIHRCTPRRRSHVHVVVLGISRAVGLTYIGSPEVLVWVASTTPTINYYMSRTLIGLVLLSSSHTVENLPSGETFCNDLVLAVSPSMVSARPG